MTTTLNESHDPFRDSAIPRMIRYQTQFDVRLEECFQQHANFSQFECPVMAVQPFGKNLDRKCPIVVKSTQLADNPAVIDFA